MASLYFRHQFPQAHILAVEPEAANFKMLARNLTDDPYTQLLEAAVAGSSGFVRIANPTAAAWGFRTEKTGDSPQSVQAHAMAELIALAQSARNCEPFIAKIDIEGFEHDLFSADVSWLDQFFMVIIELHDWMLLHRGNSLPVLRALASRNRDFILVGENIVSIANSHPDVSALP